MRRWYARRAVLAIGLPRLSCRNGGVSLRHGRRNNPATLHRRPRPRRVRLAHAAGRMRHGWRSMWRCRRCASRAANRSMATVCAPSAGRNCRSSRLRCARGLVFPSSTTRGPDAVDGSHRRPPAYARARAAVRYDDVARTLVHALKFQDRTDLAPAMGRWMARAGCELLGEADALVPVPLHWKRGWSRRYNQSGALARSIERQSGVRWRRGRCGGCGRRNSRSA